MNNLLLKTSHDCVCENFNVKLWTGIEKFVDFFQNSNKNCQIDFRMWLPIEEQFIMAFWCMYGEDKIVNKGNSAFSVNKK